VLETERLSSLMSSKAKRALRQQMLQGLKANLSKEANMLLIVVRATMGTIVEEAAIMVVMVVVEEVTMAEDGDVDGAEVEEDAIDKDRRMNTVKDLKAKVNTKRSRKGHLSTRDERDATEADVALLPVAMTRLEKK